MLRLKPRREDYIPNGALKIADKHSSAVAYLYRDRAERPSAVIFVGQRSKPTVFCHYRSDAAREIAVRQAFETERSRTRAVAVRRAERTASNQLEAGDILATCWGYEQTNREFFQVITSHGKHVTLREIEQIREVRGHDQGVCRPVANALIGNPLCRLVQWSTTVRIDETRNATKWNTGRVDGMPVGPDLRWSSYC